MQENKITSGVIMHKLKDNPHESLKRDR